MPSDKIEGCEPADCRSPLRFLLDVAAHQRSTIAGGAFFGSLWMLAQAMIPVLLGLEVDAIVAKDRQKILALAAVLLGIGLAQAGAGVMRHRRAVTGFLRAAARVQRLTAARALANGSELTSGVAAGEVASIGANDVRRIATIFDVVARTSGAVVSIVVVAIVLVRTSVPLGLVVLVGMPVVTVLIGPMMRPLERRQAAERDEIAAASGLASDVVVGLRVLRGLGGEKVFAQRYASASEQLRAASVRRGTFEARFLGLEVLVPGLFVLVVVALGAHLAIERALDLVRREPILDPESGLEVAVGSLLVIAPTAPERSAAVIDRLGRYGDSSAQRAAEVGGTALTDLPIAAVRAAILVVDKEPVILAGSVEELIDPPAADPRARRPSAATPDDSRASVTAALRAAELRRGQTTVVCTTSPLWCEAADSVVLFDGHVLSSGTHRHLLEHDRRYRALVLRDEAEVPS
jgi:ABC-type multidrug transport system fused ATPase/permease subunit